MRIGVFGGVFDPIHKGHAAVVRAALKMGLDEVILVPGPQRTSLRRAHASPKERVAMCKIISSVIENVSVSEFEAGAQTLVPTCQTVEYLKRFYPAAEFCVLLGADKLSLLPYWEGADKLFKMADILYFNRAGVNHKEALQAARKAGAKLKKLTVPITPGSSPIIRAQIARYEDAPALDGMVAAYIAQNGLYHSDLPDVASMVSLKRYRHILGVRKEAVRLALKYGVSVQKAAQAALLHDCAKEIKFSRMLELAKQAGITDANLTASPALLHGPVGAYIARTRFAVEDEEVLAAIFSHTVGAPNMSDLALVIFVADATEENREPFPGLNALRRMADTSLPGAALLEIALTQDYLLKAHKPVNELSQKTAAWLKDVVPEYIVKLTELQQTV